MVRFRLLGVLALAALVFAPALAGEFVYDDRLLIERNPKLHGLGNVLEQIAEPFWGPELAYWRPITSVLISIGYVLGGGGTFVLHLLALLAHLVAVAAAAVLVRRITGDARAGLVAALLFALHPVQVESVAWIAAINDPLQGMCGLLCLDALVRWRQRGSRGAPLGAIGWFAAAALCKETGVMIAPIAAWLDWTLRERWPAARGGALRLYGALAVVAVAWLAARMLVFGELAAGFGRTWTDPSYAGMRAATVRVEMFGRFVELLVAPFELSLFRPIDPHLPVASGTFLRAFVWAVAFAALFAIAFARRWRFVQLGLGVVLLTMLPTLVRVASLGAYPIADRYLYLAVFGSALILGAHLARRKLGLAALLALAASFAAVSFRQTAHWRSQESLVTHAVARHPDDPIAQFMLGTLLLERFDRTQDPADLDRAEQAFQRADAEREFIGNAGLAFVRRHRNEARLGLAWCALRRARLADAIARFQAVIAEDGNAARAWLGLGVALATDGQLSPAEQALRRAVELDPGSSETHYNLAFFYAGTGRKDAALEHAERALALNPANAAARAMRDRLR